ncbi:hypothetical protein HPP92_013631 [Vanilla planifolia]|uniref:sphingosine kinase n=1 Tax=Vanilla planifolia TaxID=51239 RepID=A0A835UYN4_VANPL|nr:hypothetical protein HPP92_014068 [Vanilla planifolia]KAG0478912.1 hypothetical protein HPP92_013631 [Vanilla planifolia]
MEEETKERIRVNGHPAEASLSGSGEIWWRFNGECGGGNRCLDVESEVLGFVAEGREITIRAFLSELKGQPRGSEELGKRVRKEFVLEMSSDVVAESWSERLGDYMNSLGRPKRLFIILNPYGGKASARKIFDTEIKPLLEAANILYTLQETRYQLHAQEIAYKMDLLKYDGIVCVSGDGVFVEVLNGLLQREDWNTAIKLPLGIIPAGTGNGLAKSLLDAVGEMYSIEHATFSIIRGHKRSLDVTTVLQGETKFFSILMLTWGLIADTDIESEKYRWMGSTRLDFYCFLRVLKLRKYHGRVKFVPAPGHEAYGESTEETESCVGDLDSPKDELKSSIHVLQRSYQGPNTSFEDCDWRFLEGPFISISLVNVPWVGEDAMHAPQAKFSDGFLDLVLIKDCPKSSLVSILLKMKDGKHVNSPYVLYLKVKAFELLPGNRVGEPTKGGIVDVDGEVVAKGEGIYVCGQEGDLMAYGPPIQLTVDKGLATIFSPSYDLRKQFFAQELGAHRCVTDVVMSSSLATASAAATGPKICFNTHCKEAITDQTRRKGWKLRSGELAELCERCHSAFEKGNFCETFHSDATGWRKCETCGKSIHCGCIVSIPFYMLLDAGGVECMACVRKAYSTVPNQIWSSSTTLSAQLSERSKEFSVKSWNQVAGSFPGQWRHPANIWNASSIQSDLHQRLSYEFDRPNADRLMAGARSSISAQEKKVEEPLKRIVSSGLNHVSRDIYGENDPTVSRKGICSDPFSNASTVKFEAHQNTSTKPSTVLKGESTSLLIGLSAPFSSINGTNEPSRVSTTQTQRQAASSTLSKQFYSNTLNGAESSSESPSHARNGRGRVDPRARSHLLPRYWPRITDQELQKISGDSNSIITPLFEKMLSASDAGRIGRLVLPKKCAEAYFPTISQPEGLPLKMQDASGKEWVFQFRFWPNNNSRMYVLEGVTPCIQSMQLQAGDTVTFSRIDPEGKLVMGFRKAANASNNEQDNQAVKDGHDSSVPSDVKASAMDFIASLPLRQHKGSTESRSQTNATDKASWSKNDKSGFIQKDGGATKSSSAICKKKSSACGSKNKRLRIDNEESVELKLTWEEAQVLLRPGCSGGVTVTSVEGLEFEEYEEAPVLGMPTYFTKNQDGNINDRWVQCEDCLKWRKLPFDALLHHKWTCLDNKWDIERSSCSAPQEISEDIAHLLPIKAGSSKRSKVKLENENIEVPFGLDTLANLAILGEGESLPASSQPTTKHPRHRPGCTCIVCIQPPSGKGPKHKQTCTCNVCLTVKRRFRTLMLRREKRQSEKEAESAVPAKQQLLSNHQPELVQQPPSPIFPDAGVDSPPQMPPGNNDIVDGDTVVDAESERKRTVPSPIKTQIDLNIQPEREEEPSPVANAMSSTMRTFEDSAD